MIRTLAASLAFTASLTLPAPAHQTREELAHIRADMLAPTVRVVVGDASGSGTVVYSTQKETFVLTNHHVVATRHADAELESGGKTLKVRAEVPVVVQFMDYDGNGYKVGERRVIATVVADEEHRDLALLRITDGEIHPSASLAMPGTDAGVGEEVFSVGAGLGYDPYVSPPGTVGSVVTLDTDQAYLMTTAITIMGNSGGGLYRWSEDRGLYEFVGVPSKIYGNGYSAPYAFHVAFSVPASAVNAFLVGRLPVEVSAR